jgi:thiamine phosphate synthase YjbQ (UPF0047 family)
MGDLGVPSSRKSELLGIAVNMASVLQFFGKGVCLTYASAAILRQESDGLAEKGSLNSLSDMVPNNSGFGCSLSSIHGSGYETALFGCSKAFPICKGAFQLCRQYMGFCELDGSQSQKVILEVVGR